MLLLQIYNAVVSSNHHVTMIVTMHQLLVNEHFVPMYLVIQRIVHYLLISHNCYNWLTTIVCSDRFSMYMMQSSKFAVTVYT